VDKLTGGDMELKDRINNFIRDYEHDTDYLMFRTNGDMDNFCVCLAHELEKPTPEIMKSDLAEQKECPVCTHKEPSAEKCEIERVEPGTLNTFNIRKEINSLVRNDIMELTRKVNEIIDHLNKEE
jgi:hypothetical protein